MPAYEFQGVRCFTNKPPCGPKRGHGTPQPRFGFEVHLDKIAIKLGINPADLRLNMLAEPDSITANWLKIGSMGLRRCIEAVVEGSGFRERWGKLPEGRGLGLACGSYLCGAGLPIYWNHMPQSGVMLKLDRSGGVAVFCGESEIGQGSDSILAAVVAEVLGVSLADIRLCVADTDLTPVDLGSYSSRVTLMVGNAALQAAERARELIAKAVSEQLEIPTSRGGVRRAPGVRRAGPRQGAQLPGRRDRRRGPLRHPRHHRQLHPAALARPLPGRRRRPLPRLLLLGVGDRGRGRSRDRPLEPRPRLDRPRRRPLAQPGAGDGPGRGERLHGARRGDDGGAGLPAAAEAPLLGAGAQAPLGARVQEPDLQRHAAGDHLSDRGPGPAGPLRRQGGGPGPAAAGDAGGGERHLRRRGRAGRPGADPSAHGAEGAGGQAQGR